LTPNTEMNNGICELPFDFPIILKRHLDLSKARPTTQKLLNFAFHEDSLNRHKHILYLQNDKQKRIIVN
jgi:hypothetical protein